MNKKELTRRVASVMREKSIRKPVSIPKQVFHISDDDGNKKDFVIRKTDKTVMFTTEDVEAIIDTCIEVIEDALAHGEHVSVHGFGQLGLKYMKARTLKQVGTGEPVTAEAHYIPKFSFGKDLRLSAKMYEMSLEDLNINTPLPIYSEMVDEDGE